MRIKKKSPHSVSIKTFFGHFFAIALLAFSLIFTPVAYAEPATTADDSSETTTSEEVSEDDETSCTEQLGAIGWIVCPTTGKLAEATDWIYEKIEQILIINPLSSEDGSPVYEIWKVCRDLTNIIFIIFLLIIVISQVTGLGINNYGIKKALPKLLVAAVLMNLSFLICSLAIEVSNILGKGIRDIFSAVEETAISNITVADGASSVAGLAVTGGVAAIVAVLAVEKGLIWMIIPTVLGAFVAVAAGLITIALRQALVILLVMIAPLAIVANILPNVEQYYGKWKQLLLKMLIFYPTFAVLFGASNLAGFAIIASAENGFWTLLGIAVQIFPLFFSWKLMQMSGTILGGINNAIRGVAAKPLATNRAWADSHREMKRQAYLANGRTPSARLNQFIANRRVSRELETAEYASLVKERGTAYNALSHYQKNGKVSKDGERSYEMQARSLEYQRVIATDRNNFNRGLGGFSEEYQKTLSSMKKDFGHARKGYSSYISGGVKLEDRLNALDQKTIAASDNLKFELSRGGKIDYQNAEGFNKRYNAAIDAHLDSLHVGEARYHAHGTLDAADLSRYDSILNIMEGEVKDVHFAGADAAYQFNSQAQIIQGKFQKYFDLTVSSQDVVRRLQEFTSQKEIKNIDPIIAGLRVLNQRGDTDLVRARLIETLVDPETGEKKLDLGTYSSQSLASFLMFDVKDSDPALRRFGKYINIETARIFNEADPAKRRHNSKFTLDEYINGEYEEYDVDENGNVLETTHAAQPKRSAKVLLEGTSFKGMERTAIANMTDMIRDASYDTDKDGNRTFNMEKFKKNQDNIWNAIMPNIIGDQFAFLSGSEQIKALAKGITGMDGHDFDWDGIFGKKVAASLTDDQKKDYINYLNKRTKTFLGGHVPNQIARTKSDMLAAVMDLFTMTTAAEDDDSILSKKSKTTNEEFKDLEKKYGNAADEKLIGSLKEETLKGFLKMWHKGYQGDTKANLTQHLHAEEQYKKYFGAETEKPKNRVTDEDEEGLVAGPDSPDSPDHVVDPVHLGSLENIFKNDQFSSPLSFFTDAYNYLASSGLTETARAFENHFYNDSTASVASLYNYLISIL